MSSEIIEYSRKGLWNDKGNSTQFSFLAIILTDNKLIGLFMQSLPLGYNAVLLFY